MANTRSVIAPGVFADDAITPVPPAPVQGTSYRLGTALGTSDTERGWPYGIPVDSATFNEIMLRISSLVGIMDAQGLLGWTNLRDYAAGAIVMGSDMRSYEALQASGPTTAPQDPVVVPGSNGYWAPTGGGPVGSVIYHAANTAPRGYLECDGGVVSRTFYARLFTAIGTTFGAGDGSTTFRLPDLRGEFIRGWDHGRGKDAGRIFGSAQLDALQNITGQFGSDDRSLAYLGGAFYQVPGSFATGADGSPSGPVVGFDASLVVRTATETRPTNVALMPCIKF